MSSSLNQPKPSLNDLPVEIRKRIWVLAMKDVLRCILYLDAGNIAIPSEIHISSIPTCYWSNSQRIGLPYLGDESLLPLGQVCQESRQIYKSLGVKSYPVWDCLYRDSGQGYESCPSENIIFINGLLNLEASMLQHMATLPLSPEDIDRAVRWNPVLLHDTRHLMLSLADLLTYEEREKQLAIQSTTYNGQYWFGKGLARWVKTSTWVPECLEEVTILLLPPGWSPPSDITAGDIKIVNANFFPELQQSLLSDVDLKNLATTPLIKEVVCEGFLRIQMTRRIKEKRIMLNFAWLTRPAVQDLSPLPLQW